VADADRPARERIRWRIAHLLDKLPGQCWADLVFWVFGDRRNPWSPMTSTCRLDGADGGCYCGKLREPVGAPEGATP
jgi:hypothetical protein